MRPKRPFSSYLGPSPQEVQEMLNELGLSSPLELFKDVPENLLLDSPPELPLGPMTESEVFKLFQELASMNKNSKELVSFLGGGVRQIYIPAFLDELLRRGELYTSYTPYQPETSQGSLQLLFEYQSLIAEITGMDAANASMYDWSTALGEAALMATRITRRKEFLVLTPLRSSKKSVLKNYTSPQGIKITDAWKEWSGKNKDETCMDVDSVAERITKDTSAVYLEMPNALGYLHQDPKAIAELAHENGSKFFVGVDVLSLGLITPPGAYGADLVIGEGQPLGNPSSFGGPLLGVFAFNFDKKEIRKLPGKLIGVTKEEKGGDRGFAITLQAREQHIRRGKATSNICSNEGLTAIASAIYLSSLGPQGFQELSEGLYKRAHYLARKIANLGIQAPKYKEPFFADFSVKFPVADLKEFTTKMVNEGFVPGVYLSEFQQSVLGVSEIHTKEQIDRFAEVLQEVIQ